MSEKIFVKSRTNRQISYMPVKQYESSKQSGEFIPWSDEKIKRQAKQGVRWTPFQAICYLSHYDPDDNELKPNSGHMHSHSFMNLRSLIEYAVSRRIISLEDSCDVMTGNTIKDAENIVYIRLALENGHNDIPDIFREFANGIPCATSVEVLPSNNEDHVVHANSIIKNGDGHEITFKGKKIFIKLSKGLMYIITLLQHPNREFNVNELYLIFNPNMPTEEVNVMETGLKGFTVDNDTAGSSNMIDGGTYELLEDLEERIQQAISAEKIELAETLEKQREDLIKYVKEATFKKKPRKFATDTESKRSTVQQTIKDVYQKIESNAPELYQHLKDCIKLGTSCKYKPNEEISWQVSL